MYKHILVPVDGSELSNHVFPHLETMLDGCEKTKVTLYRVDEPVRMAFGTEAVTPVAVQQLQAMQDWQKEDSKKYLADALKQLKKKGIIANAVQAEGLPADMIIDFVKKNNIDLVIMSTHGRSGISRAVFGSVAEKVLRGVCSPIMMIRSPGCGVFFNEK
jgi:nucleotide-binding universal stress UspA family protein